MTDPLLAEIDKMYDKLRKQGDGNLNYALSAVAHIKYLIIADRERMIKALEDNTVKIVAEDWDDFYILDTKAIAIVKGES